MAGGLRQQPHRQVLPWGWLARGVWKSNTAIAVQGEEHEVSLPRGSWAHEVLAEPPSTHQM